MKIIGLDVGSTTVKAVVMQNDEVVWRDYQRHNTYQAELVLEFLGRMEADCGLTAGQDRVFVTGSGGDLLAPMIGAKFVQEVVAVAAAAEKLHPDVRFVSEIGGEDMKTVFFTPTSADGLLGQASLRRSPGSAARIGKTARKLFNFAQGQSVAPVDSEPMVASAVTAAEDGSSKQVYMQSACSGGTGTFIEKTARKLGIPLDHLARMRYRGYTLHKISAKCGIFAENDANTLVKSGVPVEEIIASLYEAVVYQNLATLTKGNTPAPRVLLLGGPNLFYVGLQEAWQHHLCKVWSERGVMLPDGTTPDHHILVPEDALYYATLGCVEVGAKDTSEVGVYEGRERLREWITKGQHAHKVVDGRRGLAGDATQLRDFLDRYGRASGAHVAARGVAPSAATETVFIGCDFGSTTVKAVALSGAGELVYTCYALSKGNPIEDAKTILSDVRGAGWVRVGGLAITGYGKDLLQDIIGADVGVVETVAHASAALHYFPDADVICDVGGCDVKIMLLRQGTVSDFRLNSQCSSGNGGFLQGVAERYEIPLERYAEHAFKAQAMPTLAMGCGVFLQSDIVNQQRKGWSAEEIMASLAAVLPLNVWVYAGQLQNLAAAGKKFVLQGGTHRNLAVVKAQVDFLTSRVPQAEIVVHPYPGEAGAIGAALCAADWAREGGKPTRFRGFDTVEALVHQSTTNDQTTCPWCAVNCRRTFIDVQLPGARGRPWSKVPVAKGWDRVISGNACPKGLLEDAHEMRIVKRRIEEAKRAFPNVADMVRASAFRGARSA